MSIHYYNSANESFLSTNYKVWFSTLENQDKLKRVGDFEIAANYFSRTETSRKKQYLLVRNPYDRLESFFKDKFRKNPASVKKESAHDWQNCQQLFFKSLKIEGGESTSSIKEKLESFSFSEFVRKLPEFWNLDNHLIPQYAAQFIFTENGTEKIRFDQYLPIEKATSAEFLSAEMKLDLSVVRNSTRGVNISLEWDKEMIAVVDRIYRGDFVEFNYPFKKDEL